MPIALPILLLFQAATLPPLAIPAEPPSASRRRPGIVVTESDYPKVARRLGTEGTAGVTYRVGASGRVESCAIAATSNDADLDAGTCAVIGRSRFEPARDTAGNPVAADGALTIAWRIAGRCPVEPRDAVCVRLD